MVRQVRTLTTAALIAALSTLLSACSSSPATPAPTVSTSFAIVSMNPAFGATVSGRQEVPLSCPSCGFEQNTQNLTLNFQVTNQTAPAYNKPNSPEFLIQLRKGSTECLRTGTVYATPTTSVGNTFGFTVSAFERDISQPNVNCGANFSTDNIVFTLYTNSATGQAQTLFTQNVSGGWTFTFTP